MYPNRFDERESPEGLRAQISKDQITQLMEAISAGDR